MLSGAVGDQYHITFCMSAVTVPVKMCTTSEDWKNESSVWKIGQNVSLNVTPEATNVKTNIFQYLSNSVSLSPWTIAFCWLAAAAYSCVDRGTYSKIGIYTSEGKLLGWQSSLNLHMKRFNGLVF